MTLGRSYDELMSRIQVTDAMRARVLHRLEQEAPSASRSRSRSRLRPALAAAACLAVLIAGASVLPRMYTPTPLPTPSGPLTVVPGFQDVSSAAELAETVGFAVSDLQGLPFLVERSTYTAYDDTMAQIRCEGGDQWALFRKSAGMEDNSGDYTAYAAQLSYDLDGLAVTLKGDTQDSYLLAVWTDGTYSYSLKLSSPLSQTQWDDLITSNS